MTRSWNQVTIWGRARVNARERDFFLYISADSYSTRLRKVKSSGFLRTRNAARFMLLDVYKFRVVKYMRNSVFG